MGDRDRDWQDFVREDGSNWQLRVDGDGAWDARLKDAQQSPAYNRFGPAIAVAVAVVVMIAAVIWLTEMAPAFDNGGWGDVPPAVRSWFKGVKAPSGVPCCDIADGHGTDEDVRPDGTTWVPNPLKTDEWMQIPPEAIVYEAGNPTGRAVIWWVRQGEGVVYVRCFVHGAGI